MTRAEIDAELLLLRIRAYRIVELMEELSADVEKITEQLDNLKNKNDGNEHH